MGNGSDGSSVFSKQYRVMLVSDLDNTMVDHKDPKHTSLLEFGSLWQAEYSVDSLLVYSTGRSPTLYRDLKSQVPLITPDVVIMSVGTEVSYGGTDPDRGWEEYLNEGWNRGIIVEEAKKFEKLRFQTESEQRPHKVSFHVEKNDAPPIVEALRNRLRERGLNVKLIYSGGYDLDILPERAGKGQALAYLLRRFEEAGHVPAHTLACGDSGNDAELFEVKGAYGVIVSNAMEELIQWASHQPSTDHIFMASHRCAGGITQALRHFAFGHSLSPRAALLPPSSADVSPSNATPVTLQELTPASVEFCAARSVVVAVLWVERAVRGESTAEEAANALVDSLDSSLSWTSLAGSHGTKQSFAVAVNDWKQRFQGTKPVMWVDDLKISKGETEGEAGVHVDVAVAVQGENGSRSVVDIKVVCASDEKGGVKVVEWKESTPK